jgi:hypothetical protein
MTRRQSVLVLLLALFASGKIDAQAPPQLAPPGAAGRELLGTVRDDSGAAMPGVTIRLLARDGGAFQQTVSDEAGRFRFERVQPGVFTIEATVEGFQTLRRDNVRVSADSRASIDLVFQGAGIPGGAVGGVLESVPVSATIAAAPPPPAPVPIRWNAWMEPLGARFRPASSVEPGSQYSFVVDLAGVDYGASGVASRAVSSALSDHLREWLTEHPEYTESHLTVLILPDAKALRTIGDGSSALTISLAKLRAFADSPPPEPPSDAMASLRTNPDAPYVFGRLRFTVAVEPGFEGFTSVGLSIWHGMRPVDELVLSFCVARASRTRTCSGSRPVAQTLHGIDAARLGVDRVTTDPDLALHFIDFPGQHVIGTLRLRDWPATRFTTWSLALSATEFKSRLNGLSRELRENTETEARRRIGLALYGLLFPLPASRQARTQFEAAVRSVAGTTPFETDLPPLLFIRSILTTATDAPFIPAGLLYPPSVQAFVGYHLRTEMPLPVQTYDATAQCIDRWVFLVPPRENTEQNLRQARLALGDTSDRWQQAGGRVFNDVPSFAEWIGADARDEAPVSLAVLSHHEENALRFTSEEAVFAENINRSLDGSIAILSACGSAPPGPGAVVHRLNRSGVVAIIGTTSNIRPDVGAAMLRALAAAGESAARPDAMTLAQVFRRAQKMLFERASVEGYVPSDVLKYMLLGDAGVRICTPAAGSN